MIANQPEFPMTFSIFSMTKPITSVAMCLFEEGKILLHQPIANISELADLRVYDRLMELATHPPAMHLVSQP